MAGVQMNGMYRPRPDGGDWLGKEMSSLPQMFVSGTRYRISDGPVVKVSVRIIAHRPTTEEKPKSIPRGVIWMPSRNVLMRKMICVEVALPDRRAVASAILGGCWPMLSMLKEALGGVGVSVVVHLAEDDAAPFWIIDREAGIDGEELTPGAYAGRLNRERGGTRIGYIKPINGRCGDAMHRWSRSHLAGNMSVCDLDAIWWPSESVRPVFLELKSSTWTIDDLYFQDAPNFLVLQSVCREITGGFPVVLRSDPSRPGVVGFFVLTEVANDGLLAYTLRIDEPDAASAISTCLALMSEVEKGSAAGMRPVRFPRPVKWAA